MSAPLYECRNLIHRYTGREALRLEALDIPRGSILGLAGPNGSGKSTLLRTLAFLQEPSGGTLRFDGRTVQGDADRARLRRQVTLLLQEAYLLRRRVFDNVAYGLRVRGDKVRLAERVAEAMDMAGLDYGAFARRQWFELSGGEAQRVAMAARLVLRPMALLLDEPTASLDVKSTKLVQQAALKAREAWGTTLVVASHDQEWLASVADSVLRMGDHSV